MKRTMWIQPGYPSIATSTKKGKPKDKESFLVREVDESIDGPEGWVVISMDTCSVLVENHYGRRKRFGFEIDDSSKQTTK